MRNAFIESLLDEAGRRENVFLVVGDLGFSVIEPFAEAFPERYLNAGVAEQNMTGIAAGLGAIADTTCSRTRSPIFPRCGAWSRFVTMFATTAPM